MKKKFLFLALFPLMMTSLTGCNKKADFKVGIIQWVSHPALDKATKGFKQGLRAALGDKTVDFEVKNAADDPTLKVPKHRRRCHGFRRNRGCRFGCLHSLRRLRRWRRFLIRAALPAGRQKQRYTQQPPDHSLSHNYPRISVPNTHLPSHFPLCRSYGLQTPTPYVSESPRNFRLGGIG